MIRYIEGSSYFVTSITAPIASGWSEIAGWDLHPLGKRRLCTAHVDQKHPGIMVRYIFNSLGNVATQ